LKAVLCASFGPPEALEIADLPRPRPGPGEALVEVRAAALNFFDTLIIAGRYQHKPDFPFSPAAEFAGVVGEIGPGVVEVAPGDRVCGYRRDGAAREMVVVPARGLVRIPDGIDFERAAGLIVTNCTAIHALEDRARLAPGETLAVLGAAGGVGLAAVEIGKILGARAIACASSAEKLAFARAHGADEIIDYERENLKERLRELTGGHGADVVFDPVGGRLAEPAVRGTAWEGRYLVVGFAAGEIPRLPLNHVLLRGCAVMGVGWGEFIRRNPNGIAAAMKRVLEWVREGRLTAHVDGVYPFDGVVEALRAIADRKVKGKIILVP
jgi:NADPH2:quinone reductase